MIHRESWGGGSWQQAAGLQGWRGRRTAGAPRDRDVSTKRYAVRVADRAAAGATERRECTAAGWGVVGVVVVVAVVVRVIVRVLVDRCASVGSSAIRAVGRRECVAVGWGVEAPEWTTTRLIWSPPTS
jgi:hypothetical protein